MMNGYRRDSAYTGIRNKLLILYTVNCSAHIAQSIGEQLYMEGINVDVAGNESCYDNQAMVDQLLRLSVHPNVGSVLVVGHGCEFIQAGKIAEFAKIHGRPSETIYGQHLGTSHGIIKGMELGRELYHRIRSIPLRKTVLYGMTMGVSISAFDETVFACLPSLGKTITFLISQGVSILMAEHYLCGLNLAEKETCLPAVAALQKKTEAIYQKTKLDDWKGNKTEIETFFLKHAAGCVKIAQVPNSPGIWFSDSLPDYGSIRGPVNGGIAGELMQYVGNGAVLNLMVTGRGTPVGSAVAPTLILTGNRETKEYMEENVDLFIDPMEETAIQETSMQILDLILRTGDGSATVSERDGQCRALLYQNAQN